MSIWAELGIQPTNNLSDIQHAFAQRVKTCHPEEDPEGFQRLNEAYRTAAGFSRRLNAAEAWTPPQGTGGVIRPWVAPLEEGPALGLPTDGAWRERGAGVDDTPLDFAALIAKGVLAERQPKPLGRIQSFLTHVSPSLKTWSERHF